METSGSGSDTEASGYGSDSNKCNTNETSPQLSDWEETDSKVPGIKGSSV